MGPPTLEICSTSSSIKQYQFYLITNSPWDIERLLCKSELGCSDKIRLHKKSFAAYLTNYTGRVKKPAFICSKLTIETLEQGAKYIQS